MNVLPGYEYATWEKGGISPYQAEAGRTMAEAEGRPYESYGAEPA